jgi:outer membrane protein assembly factor BamB
VERAARVINQRNIVNGATLVLLDLDGTVLWRKTQVAPFMSAVLATGRLIFVSDYDRYLYALDAENGNVLWKTRTASTGHGFPATLRRNKF